jgi:hypothetical protein
MKRPRSRTPKVYHVKLGTMPAAVHFAHAYRFRPGLKVVYKRVDLRDTGWWPVEEWQTALVTSTDPIIFLDRM